ncbi:hypothetical protein [Pedobacter deserti]|uniref:hypothetical protein n=1 Tax=Pedobacter deserti TaxID=2817382 RepID=UPI00210939BE|nr:hypothetical protein [Pedobacter sp. SYSU D00382]
MKTKDILLILFALLSAGVVLYACKNPGEGVTININTNVLKAPTAVQFVNAVDGAATQPNNFPVTIGGPDADKVVTADNKTTFNASEGRIFLALKKGVMPSESDPIVFTVAAEVPGFTPATHTFRITADEPQSVVVPVIEYANPVPGTAVVVEEFPLQGGVNTAPISIETSSNGAMTEQASIVVPAGTEFRDAQGNKINAAQLESRVVQFGTESAESLAAFPGGFNVANIIGENGQPIPGGVAFVTAGFIAMDMYAGGTEIKSFSKPLEITMDVNPAVVNSQTGATVKEGDIVPVWSLDDKTGQWKFESNATIVEDAQGKLSASFQASHLSYWNFDWINSFCQNRLSITFSAPNYEVSAYRVEVEASNGYRYSTTMVVSDNKTISERVPSGNLKIRVYSGPILITETDYFDGCSGSITVNFPPKAAVDLVNVAMTLQGVCPNKPLNENIDSWAVVYEKGKTRAQGTTVYVKLGKLNLKLKNNTEYVVEAQYGNNWKTAEILFKKENFTFPGTVSGTATYVQSTNTVNVLAQFKLPNCN